MRGREKISLRTIHYWFSTKKVAFPEGYKGGKYKDGTQKPHYMNDEGCLALCNLAVKYARNLGLVRYDQIVDEKTSEPKDNTRLYTWRSAETELSWDIEEPEFPDPDLPNLSFPDLPSFGIREFAVPQKYHLEVWCEKSTMNHILEPLANMRMRLIQNCFFQAQKQNILLEEVQALVDKIGTLSSFDIEEWQKLNSSSTNKNLAG
jgi:hypothetical protein